MYGSGAELTDPRDESLMGASDKSSAAVGTSRSLVWVPIIHTPEDMGRLRELVEKTYVSRLGKTRWDAHIRGVGEIWKDVRRSIEGLNWDWGRVRIYQDGLAVCGHEEKIVRELAATGSANHRLLADLVDRGAKLMGTESPQLLIEEYELNRCTLESTKTARHRAVPAARFGDQARRLLAKRDAFIAARIAGTLEPGEQGLIFLGMLHSLARHLPRDIRLSSLKPGDSAPHPRLPSFRS